MEIAEAAMRRLGLIGRVEPIDSRSSIFWPWHVSLWNLWVVFRFLRLLHARRSRHKLNATIMHQVEDSAPIYESDIIRSNLYVLFRPVKGTFYFWVKIYPLPIGCQGQARRHQMCKNIISYYHA